MNGIAALAFVVLVSGLGCSGDPSRDRDGAPRPSGGSGGQVEMTGGSGGGDVGNPSDASTSIDPCLQSVPTQDVDDDGYTLAEGDCNDCIPTIHPDAEEILDNGADEDCDGLDTVAVSDGGTTSVAQHCDDALVLDSADAMDGARAIGLCEGVTMAAYTNAIGEPGLDSPLQTGLVDRFGVLQPREGQRMLLLSTGVARTPEQPDYTPDCDSFIPPGSFAIPPSPAPPDHPRPTSASVCGDRIVFDSELFNVAALSLTLRAPEDAHALSIDFNFYSAEYPTGVCSISNDAFVILMDPPPAGADYGNVAFDSEGNTLNVNSGLMRVCTPPDPVLNLPREFDCPLGTDELEGTGYGDADDVNGCTGSLAGSGATGWLTTSVPVTSGAVFTLRFVIWEAGGPGPDSSVLVDNIRWTRDADDVTTEVPITKPAGPS